MVLEKVHLEAPVAVHEAILENFHLEQVRPWRVVQDKCKLEQEQREDSVAILNHKTSLKGIRSGDGSGKTFKLL